MIPYEASIPALLAVGGTFTVEESLDVKLHVTCDAYMNYVGKE